MTDSDPGVAESGLGVGETKVLCARCLPAHHFAEAWIHTPQAIDGAGGHEFVTGRRCVFCGQPRHGRFEDIEGYTHHPWTPAESDPPQTPSLIRFSLPYPPRTRNG